MPRVLVLDSYDSFVYNLVQYLGELGAEPLVYRNDELRVAKQSISLQIWCCSRQVLGGPRMLGFCVRRSVAFAELGHASSRRLPRSPGHWSRVRCQGREGARN